MASPETIGTCPCENCASVAYVKKNRGGLPYYRCGSCDHEGRAHSQRGARIFMQKVTLLQAEAPAADPEKTGEKPAPVAVKPPPKKSMVDSILNGF